MLVIYINVETLPQSHPPTETCQPNTHLHQVMDWKGHLSRYGWTIWQNQIQTPLDKRNLIEVKVAAAGPALFLCEETWKPVQGIPTQETTQLGLEVCKGLGEQTYCVLHNVAPV